jgi:predicted nucleic acid-binding protein
MTLIDSSAWIELFRATGSDVHVRLRALVESGEELATTEPVSMELLAGARSPGHRRQIRRTLAACTMLPVGGSGDWEAAASLYVRCRQGGTTPGRLLDCLIAVVAMRAMVPILARDRDFSLIAEHADLELAI